MPGIVGGLAAAEAAGMLADDQGLPVTGAAVGDDPVGGQIDPGVNVYETGVVEAGRDRAAVGDTAAGRKDDSGAPSAVVETAATTDDRAAIGDAAARR